MKRILTVVLLMGLAFGLYASGEQEGASAESDVVTEISWFVNEGWFNRPWNPESPVDAKITEETNTTILFSNSAGGGTGTEKLNAMIAADDLPDVVTMGWWYSQFQELQSAGMVLPLNEVLAEKNPDFFARVPDFMKNWYTFDDGNWYGFANMFWAKEQFTEANFMETNVGMVARKDIMDQLGISAKDFETQDGMIEALKKVKAAGLEYNGLNVVPLYFTPNGGFPGTYVWDGMFQLPREDRNGNLVNKYTDPVYLEQMRFGNRLYREGLISKENWTADRNQINEKIVSGSIFAMMCNLADYRNQWIQLAQADPSVSWVPVGPVRNSAGDRPYLNSTGLTGWLVSMISHNSKNVDGIVDLWDYLYSREGLMLYTYGVEGDSYNLVDGRVQWTDKYLGLLNDPDTDPTQVYGNNSLWLLHNSVISQQLDPPPATKEEQMIFDIRAYFAQFAFDDTAFQNMGPFGGTDEATINAEVTTYLEGQEPKMILAESDAELMDAYEETVAYLTKLGYDRVVEVQNERFQFHKNKLKIDFAFPPLQ